MARKDSDLTSLVREGADELRGVVEKALAERPMLVLGLALELGLLAGHWVRGGKVSPLEVAKRALAVSPESFMAAIMSGRKKPSRTASRRATPARRASARRKTKTPKSRRKTAAKPAAAAV
jgi:hypothetical protein